MFDFCERVSNTQNGQRVHEECKHLKLILQSQDVFIAK
jgi:hypothetical protein